MALLLDDKKHVRICRKEFPTKDDDAADIIWGIHANQDIEIGE